jgi:hypothetical protein
MIFENNLTFAILLKDVAWRADLTMRFTEYFSAKLNGADFIKNIIFPESVDEALAKCETEFLIVQSSGHVIYNFDFFVQLEKQALLAEEFFLGHIELAEDYAIVDERCIFFNMNIWKEAGSPAFNSQIREGYKFSADGFVINNKLPFTIIALKEEPRVYIPHEAGTAGGGMIAAQLDKFDKLTSINKFEPLKVNHYLSTATPYFEIHSETIFEKSFLPATRKIVYTFDDDVLPEVEGKNADIVVAPANGLKAHTLAHHFNASTVYVFDNNPDALELQRRIFNIDKSYLYSHIISDFQKDFPDVVLTDDWRLDANTVVVPTTAEIHYRLIDAFSFEMEDLIKEIDDELPAVFDLSDIYVYPYNFYRKPLYQIEGLFSELYSLMKSRRGPTHIFGLAPGFQAMDEIEINTSKAQFEHDATVDPFAHKEGEEVPEVPELFYHPNTSAPRLPEQEIKKSWISAIKDAVSLPKKNIREIIREVIVEKIVEIEKPIYVDRIVEVEKPAAVAVFKEIPAAPTFQEMTPVNYGLHNGYKQVSVDDDNIVLTKLHSFPEIEAMFEYTVNEATYVWSFKVTKVGKDKKIEFSNGTTRDGMISHMKQDIKINPKTVARYFQ